MHNLLSSIGRMLDGFSFGNTLGKVGIVAGSLVAAFYSPIALLLLACFAFTVTDLIYGLKVAKMLKKKLTSKKNWKGTLSKLEHEFVILSLARLLELAVLDETGVFVLTGGATVIISLTELWSILENLNTLNPEGPWKLLGKFLKKKGEDFTGLDLEVDGNSNNSQMDIKES